MGAALAGIRALFPCMSGGNGEHVITIKSSSECCRGQTVQIKLQEHHVKEISALISKLVEQGALPQNADGVIVRT